MPTDSSWLYKVPTYPRTSKRTRLPAAIAEARRFLRRFSPRISSLVWSQVDDQSEPYQNGISVLTSISGYSRVLPRCSAAPEATKPPYNCEAVLAVMWYWCEQGSRPLQARERQFFGRRLKLDGNMHIHKDMNQHHVRNFTYKCTWPIIKYIHSLRVHVSRTYLQHIRPIQECLLPPCLSKGVYCTRVS